MNQHPLGIARDTTVHVQECPALDDRPGCTCPPCKTIQLSDMASFIGLSYYTLCRLGDATAVVFPMHALPARIANGQYKGELVVDDLGNFISFS